MVKMVKAKFNLKRLEKLGITDYKTRDDIKRIRKVFQERGYKVSKTLAYLIWTYKSRLHSSGWLDMDGYSDDVLFLTLGKQLIDENGQSLQAAVLENRQKERF